MGLPGLFVSHLGAALLSSMVDIIHAKSPDGLCDSTSGQIFDDSMSALQTISHVSIAPANGSEGDSGNVEATVGDVPMGACGFGSLEYAVSIDGRDAAPGPHAYSGFDAQLLEMHDVLTDTPPQSKEPLSLAVFDGFRETAGGGMPYRGAWYGVPMVGSPMCSVALSTMLGALAGCVWADPNKTGGYISQCMSLIDDCEAKQQLVVDVPARLINVSYTNLSTPKDSDDRCIEWILPVQDLDPVDELTALFKTYNEELQLLHVITEIGDRRDSGKRLLKPLAKLLRSLAWLHPLCDDNGRLRNLILQREVRRLGLGCGVMMYNNNRDIYFTSTATYVDKILFGLAAADAARETGNHPWLNSTRVAVYHERFDTPALSKCPENEEWGSIE